MFDSVSGGEWLVLLAVILIIVGPKNLPSAARKVGEIMSKLRRAADEFKRQIMTMDEEMKKVTDDIKKEYIDIPEDSTDYGASDSSDEPYDYGSDDPDYPGYDGGYHEEDYYGMDEADESGEDSAQSQDSLSDAANASESVTQSASGDGSSVTETSEKSNG